MPMAKNRLKTKMCIFSKEVARFILDKKLSLKTIDILTIGNFGIETTTGKVKKFSDDFLRSF